MYFNFLCVYLKNTASDVSSCQSHARLPLNLRNSATLDPTPLARHLHAVILVRPRHIFLVMHHRSLLSICIAILSPGSVSCFILSVSSIHLISHTWSACSLWPMSPSITSRLLLKTHLFCKSIPLGNAGFPRDSFRRLRPALGPDCHANVFFSVILFPFSAVLKTEAESLFSLNGEKCDTSSIVYLS